MTFDDFKEQASVYVEYPVIGGASGATVSVEDAMSCHSLPHISLEEARRLKLISNKQYLEIADKM